MVSTLTCVIPKPKTAPPVSGAGVQCGVLLNSAWQVTGLAALLAGGHARVADMGLARWLTAENMANLTGETGGWLPCEHHSAGKCAQQAAARQCCMRPVAAHFCAALRVACGGVHPVPHSIQHRRPA